MKTKLSDAALRRIYIAYRSGEELKTLARAYGVSAQTVYKKINELKRKLNG